MYKNGYDRDGRKKKKKQIWYWIIILKNILNFELSNFKIFQRFLDNNQN